MLLKKRTNRKGFTLVEIMIVVAIIALLATIAVPSFLRVRKRSQATRILEELRLVANAKDQWAIEKNKVGADEPKWTDLKPYFKKGSSLEAQDDGDTGKDSLGHDFTLGAVDTAPNAATETMTEFKEVTTKKFWGEYLDTANAGGIPDDDTTTP